MTRQSLFTLTLNRISKHLPKFFIERSIDWSDFQIRREIGAALQRTREAESISLSDATKTTGIHERHLTLLEEGKWHQLPIEDAGSALIEKYADEIGLDLDSFTRARIRVGPSILSLFTLTLLMLLVLWLLNLPPKPLAITTYPDPAFIGTPGMLSGTGEPDYQIEVLVANSVVASTTVAANGNWSVEIGLEQPGKHEVIVRMGEIGSAGKANSKSVMIAVATPTSTPTATPTPTSTPTFTKTPSPTPTVTLTPTLMPTPTSTPTRRPPTPTPGPLILSPPTRAKGWTSNKQNTPYFLGIDVDNQNIELSIEMTTTSIPPKLVDEFNIFIVDDTGKAQITLEDIPPERVSIDAGVIKSNPDGEVVITRISRPVGNFHLVIFNRSTTAVYYELEIYNGEFYYAD